MTKFTRAWTTLAPKLIAFLATGLTSTALIAIASSLGVDISPTLAAILVGGLASVAGFIQKDNLLALAPGQFSLKVLSFVLSSATAVTVIALAAQLGLDLTHFSVLIGLVLTGAATIVGYFTADQTTA